MGCCFSSNKVGDEKSEAMRRESKNKQQQQQQGTRNSNQQQPSREEQTEEWKSMIATLSSNNELIAHVQAKNRQQFQSLREAGDYLAECQAAHTDMERAWLVFLWVTDNIEYDVEEFTAEAEAEAEANNPNRNNNNNNNNPNKGHHTTQSDAQSAFISGRAICAGYADLYRELCTRLGVECVDISGYAKGFHYELGSKLSKENHQWNAVCVDGQWRFVDSTWGAGFVTQDYKFVKNFKPYYFATPAHIFNETHYSTKFQLPGAKKTNASSLQEFERSHPNTLDYHVLGLKCQLTDKINITPTNNYNNNNNNNTTTANRNGSYNNTNNYNNNSSPSAPNRNTSIQLINSEIRSPHTPLVVEYTSPQRLHLKSKLFDAASNAQIKNMTLIQSDFSSKQGTFKYCLIVDLPQRDTKYLLVLYGVNKEPAPGVNYPELSKYSVMLVGDEINEDIPRYNLSFDYHIKLKSHNTQLIKFATNPLEMEFVVPNTSVASFKVTKRDETIVENAVLAQKTLESTSSMLVSVALPQPNETYLLKLYAKPAKEAANKNFNYVTQMQLVRTDSNERDSIKYVTIFNTDFKAYVHSPVDYQLRSNRIYEFRCCVRDAFRVALQDNEKKWHQLAKALTAEQGGVDPPNTWTLSKAISSRGKLTLFVQFDEQKSYNGFCCYEVVA